MFQTFQIILAIFDAYGVFFLNFNMSLTYAMFFFLIPAYQQGSYLESLAQRNT